MRQILRLILAVSLSGMLLAVPVAGVASAQSTAAIHLNRASAAAGDAVSVTGTSFTPGATVTVSMQVYVNGSAHNVTVNTIAAPDGKIAARLQVPAGTTPGSYRITATAGQDVSASQHLAVLPTLVINRYSTQPATVPVSPGHYMYVKGSGYPQGHSVRIAITFPLSGGGSTQLVRTPTVYQGGWFETAIQVPQSAAQITLKLAVTYAPNPSKGFQKTAYVSIVPYAALQAGANPSSLAITAPKPFYAQGSGFAANEDVQLSVTFPLYNGTSVTVTKTVATDASGNFNATLIRMPTDTKQTTVTLSASGSSSKKQATVNASVVYRPYLTLSSKTVRPGGSVTVSGYGYAPNSTVQFVLATANGVQTATLNEAATTDASGHFSTTVTVPADFSAGSYTLTAKGAVTGATASTALTAALTPTVTIQPGTATPGQTVKVTGQGFSANVAVTLTINVPLYGGGTRAVTKTVGADANGNFTTYMTIPGHAAAGTVTVTAKGPSSQASAHLGIGHIAARISVSPATAVPGSTIIVYGSGYPANDTIDLGIAVRMADGSTRTLTAVAHAGPKGNFVQRVAVPNDAAIGTYTVTARSESSGR
jgi:hypothetical protein